MVSSGRGCDEVDFQTLRGGGAWTSEPKNRLECTVGREGGRGHSICGRQIDFSRRKGRSASGKAWSDTPTSFGMVVEADSLLSARRALDRQSSSHMVPLGGDTVGPHEPRKSTIVCQTCGYIPGATWDVFRPSGSASRGERNPGATASPPAILAHRSNDGSDNARPIVNQSVSRTSPSLALCHVGWPSGLYLQLLHH